MWRASSAHLRVKFKKNTKQKKKHHFTNLYEANYASFGHKRLKILFFPLMCPFFFVFLRYKLLLFEGHIFFISRINFTKTEFIIRGDTGQNKTRLASR